MGLIQHQLKIHHNRCKLKQQIVVVVVVVVKVVVV